MNPYCLKFRRRNICVVGMTILTMLCGGMFPQTELCQCEDCSCSIGVLRRQAVSEKSAVDSSTPRRHCCCHVKHSSTTVGTANSLSSCGCSGPSGKCRCSKISVFRMTAVRPSVQRQNDGVKKSLDILSGTVAKNVLSLMNGVKNKVWCQYHPHIHLPRLHLLLSVLLN